MGLWKSRDNPNWVIDRPWVITESISGLNTQYIIILLKSEGYKAYWEEYPSYTYSLGEQEHKFLGTNTRDRFICAQRQVHDNDIVVTAKQVIDALVKLKKAI